MTRRTDAATTITTTTRLDDDGYVVTVPAARFWDVHEQAWRVLALDSIADETIATLSPADRELIATALGSCHD